MRRERRDVWITDDGASWLNEAEARAHDQRLRIRKLVDSNFWAGMGSNDIEDVLCALVQNGVFLMPSRGEPETGRLI